MMKKFTLFLSMFLLFAVQDVSAQCIPTSVRPVFGTVTGASGTFTYANMPTGNVLQIVSPAAGTFYDISLCSTNPAGTADGVNDSYLTILDVNSAAASALATEDDGCTTNIPNGWGPTDMSYTAPGAGTYFVYLTEYDAAGAAFCVADGLNTAYQMVVTVTGAPPACEAGTLTSPLTQTVCPGQTGTIATSGNSTPSDYSIGFLPGPSGTGGNQVGFTLTGVATLPYTFDDDLNGVLSGQTTPFPPLSGEWFLTLYATDASGTNCDSTAVTSVTFASATDPACGGSGIDAAISLANISEYSAVPLSQVTSYTPSCTVVNNGTSTVTGVSVSATITANSTNTVVYSTTMTQASLAASASTNLTASTSFTPTATDVYIAEFIVSITQTDAVAANDTFITAIAIEDSLYARDFFLLTGDVAILDGPWFVGAGNNGQLGNVFRAEANTDLVSATAVFGGGFAIGDQTQANLYSMSAGAPGALIASSAVLTVTAADTPVIFYDFIFPAGTSLTAGTDYFISVQQNAASSAGFGLYSSAEIYTPFTSFLQIATGEWIAMDTSGIGNQTFMVRANVFTPTTTPCSMDDVAPGAQTLCVPATNTYTQEVTVTYTSPPASGMLDVNGQMFAITSSPQTVTLTGLTADGLAVNVTATFTANTGCTYTENGVFTAPADCTPACAISALTAGAQTPCVNTTNNYTQEVTVTYSTPPTSGMLNVNGQTFPITSSPQTVTLVNLNADGAPVNVTAFFTADVGCTLTQNALFTAPVSCLCPTIGVNVITSSNTNCSSPNGTANVVITGGATPYTFAWTPSGFGTGQNLTGLPSGTYSVVVTDANGCTGMATGNVSNTAGVNAVVGNVTNATCNSSADGQITINTTGGTTPINYTWSDQGFPTSIFSRSNLPAGSYTVVVSDAGGCTVNLGPIAITAPPALTVNLAGSMDVSCNGGNNGSIDMTIAGGTSPYTNSWTNSTSTSEDLAGLAAGTYQLSVTDFNNCPVVTGPQVTITEPTPIVINVNGTTDVSCNGGADGGADVSVSGGTPGYAYNWGAGNSTSEDLMNAAPGSYQLTVTDANSCTETGTSVNIGEPSAISVTLSSTDETNSSADDGTATATAAGGTAPYTYLWDDASAQTSAVATGLDAGTYNVVVTDANGCTTTMSVVVDLGNGIRTIDLERFQVYPNPTSKDVSIAFEGNSIADYQISIFSTIGNRVFVDEITQTTSYNKTIDVSNFAAGVYFVEVGSEQGKVLKKLTIVK